MQIVDRSRGETLSTWRHGGASYVAGRPGDRYAVRLTNRSSGRVLVVLSVDGVNAVSGETAAVAQTGYVLAPYQSAEITGWRKSYSEAAAFYFTALPDSYAARTGRPDNVGVIGAAVFRERVQEPIGGWFQQGPPVAAKESGAGNRMEAERQTPAAPAGTMADAAPAQDAARRSRAASRSSPSAHGGPRALARARSGPVRPEANQAGSGTNDGNASGWRGIGRGRGMTPAAIRFCTLS